MTEQSPIPITREGMTAAGYYAAGKSRCRGCGQWIEWWRTPNKALLPVDDGTLRPHWASCPAAARFKRKKAVK